MKPVYLSIQQQETGRNIKHLLMKNGYTVKDIQEAMGFENPQAVYKWLSGKSLPSIDNFIILSRVLHTSIEEILVVDEDLCFRDGSFFTHYCPGDSSKELLAWGLTGKCRNGVTILCKY